MNSSSRLAVIAMAYMFMAIIPRTAQGDDALKIKLAESSNTDLIIEYERAGEGLIGTRLQPNDMPWGYSNYPIDVARTPAGVRWLTVRAELLNRGSAIVPELISFLERDAPKSREPSEIGFSLSFTESTLRILEKIGDPRTASIALRILEGWQGKVNKHEQQLALFTIERITRFRFRTLPPHRSTYSESVEHAKAIDIKLHPSFKAIATLHKQWLNGEGRDPSRWPEMASIRAHELLSSKDMEKVYCAASFLSPAKNRDHAPMATMTRLAEIVENMKKTPGKNQYTFEGSPVPNHFSAWIGMLAAYGPRARPYSALLLKIQKEQSLNSSTGYAAMRMVGGPEIVSFLIDVLPKINTEIEKIRSELSPDTRLSSGDPRLLWFDTYRQVRLGIDRWAGRIFDSDADRLAWWESNKMKSPQEWLWNNLQTLVEQVDRSVPWSRWIAYEVLPDLQKYISEDENHLPGNTTIHAR